MANGQYIKNIQQLSPNINVTDESLNLVINQLQNNINYIANLMSNCLASSKCTGNNITNVFNSYETKNTWISVVNNNITNEQNVVDSDLDLLIWNGPAHDCDTNEYSYLQRDYAIPPSLRGQKLVFAIKGTGLHFIPTSSEIDSFVNGEIPYCDCGLLPGSSGTSGTSGTPTSGTSGTSGTPTSGTSGTNDCVLSRENNCFARYEDITIKITGTTTNIVETVTIGPWIGNDEYFDKYPNNAPKMLTKYILFTVPATSESIRVKIYRNRNDGAIAISNIFVGIMPVPYDSYTIQNLDINEIYDYNSNLEKIHATTLLGHTLAENLSASMPTNILTKEQILQAQMFNQYIDDFNWDQISGPQHIELDNLNVSTPKIAVFDFDDTTRYLHFYIRVDGPDPGDAHIGFSHFGTVGTVKVYTKVINPGDNGNPDLSEYNTFTTKEVFSAPTSPSDLGYFEIHGNLYNGLKANKGALVYFTIEATNLKLASVKIGLDVNKNVIEVPPPIQIDPCEPDC